MLMLLMVKVVTVVVVVVAAAVVMPSMRGRSYFIMKVIRCCGGGAFKGVLGRHFSIPICQSGAIQRCFLDFASNWADFQMYEYLATTFDRCSLFSEPAFPFVDFLLLIDFNR